jgi:hypothetical protein
MMTNGVQQAGLDDYVNKVEASLHGQYHPAKGKSTLFASIQQHLLLWRSKNIP